MEATQLNFLDILEGKRKHVLHPALESWQDGFSSKTLCKTMKNAEKNDVGVYVKNYVIFPVGSQKKEYMELRIALDNNQVFCVLNIQTGAPLYYGQGSPLTEDSYIHFYTDDDSEFVETHLANLIYNRIEMNGNLSHQQKERMFGMIDQLVEKAMKKITEN